MIQNRLRVEKAIAESLAEEWLSKKTGHKGPLCGNCNSRTDERVDSPLPYGYICPKCEQVWEKDVTKQTTDRPVTPGTGSIGSRDGIDDPPRANCGCPTYWSIDETMEIQIWKAEHEVGCARIPVRRREAILATKEKNKCMTSD